MVRKHLPKSIATAKGHLQQECQGLRSTQLPSPSDSVTSSKPVMTTKNNPQVQTNWVYMQRIEVTRKIHSSQTGRFPITSSQGNKYRMIVFNYDSNAILAKPIKSRTEIELIRAYTKLRTYLTNRGLNLKRLEMVFCFPLMCWLVRQWELAMTRWANFLAISCTGL
jgi:hypothetical protein